MRLVGGAARLSLFAFRLYFPGENFLLIDPVSISVLTGVSVPISQGPVDTENHHPGSAHERADDVVCCKSPFLQSQMRKSAAPRSQMTRREKR